MAMFQSLSSNELVILSAAIASSSFEELDLASAKLFGTFLIATGSLVLTVAAHTEIIEKRGAKTDNSYTDSDLKNQVYELQEQVEKLRAEIEHQT